MANCIWTLADILKLQNMNCYLLQEVTSATVWTPLSEILPLKLVSVPTVLKLVVRESVSTLMNVPTNLLAVNTR